MFLIKITYFILCNNNLLMISAIKLNCTYKESIKLIAVGWIWPLQISGDILMNLSNCYVNAFSYFQWR